MESLKTWPNDDPMKGFLNYDLKSEVNHDTMIRTHILSLKKKTFAIPVDQLCEALLDQGILAKALPWLHFGTFEVVNFSCLDAGCLCFMC